MILLNPGPVKLSPRVREALTREDLCHREPEFAMLQDDIRARLLNVYALSTDSFAPVLLAGSGTAAVEAMLSSIIPKDGRVLVIENGVYGERMSCMLEVHGIAHSRLSYAWGERINFNDVVRKLQNGSAFTHVAVVHHETTTGRLNDLAALGEICNTHNVSMLVDGVSSFGAEAIDFVAWRITACAATANKCLHASPGVSFVVVNRQALTSAEHVRRTLYLDLSEYCRAQDSQTTPYTQPIHLYYAFREALVEFEEQGGWQARQQRYRELAGQVRQALMSLGVTPVLNEAESSVVLNAYHLPKAIDYSQLHDALKVRGFVIYAGQGVLQQSLFRISTMGDISDDDIDRLIRNLREIILQTD